MIRPEGSSLPDRFWSKVEHAGDHWLWTGAITSRGYGAFSHDGRSQSVHRLSWVDAHAPIPTDMTVDHVCRVRHCVNPSHMEIVTAAENVRRGHASRTHCPQGHEYTPENTRVNAQECRSCIACAIEHSRAARARLFKAAP